LTADLESRLAQLEALQELRDLVSRYAVAVDSRDLDALVSLYVPDVRVGRWGNGREALRAYFREMLSDFGVSVHIVVNHLVTFGAPGRAAGTAYCRAEHEWQGKWMVLMLQYDDEYEQADGRWLFRRRKPLAWWARDELERPHGPDWMSWPGRESMGALPQAWPTWHAYWDALREERREP
jgi:ketosteroid isomerase-like protein